MTIHWWHVYLVGQMDSMRDCAFVFAVVSFIAMIITAVEVGVLNAEEYADDARRFAVWLKRSAMALVASCLLLAVIPNSQTLAGMLLLPAVVNNERVQATSGEVWDLLDAKLQEWKTEATKEDGK